MVVCFYRVFFTSGTTERALGKNSKLRILRAELLQVIQNGNCDSFLLYLYGIILKKTSEMSTSAQRSEAISYLCQSVKQFPMNWSAWFELSSLVSDQQSVSCSVVIL